jgi:topoisomerase-4 subunit A
VYSVAVSLLPGARGDGQPLTTFIELEAGSHLVHYFAGAGNVWLLLSNSGGYGFVAAVDNLVSRQKGGKSFLSLGAGETVCRPSLIGVPQTPGFATHVCCASSGKRILTFEISELKPMANGGRGLMLMDLEPKEELAGAAAYTRSVRIVGLGRGDKEREEVLEIRSLNNAKGTRGRKGKVADLGFKPLNVLRVE